MATASVLSLLLATVVAANPVDGNRLAYLDGHDIYYPHKNFPKLITPQWVGEDGVEAVVILAIDDMREPPKYEAYLRPILQRLKQIDGRAPVSIMTCAVKPDDPQLQTWLAEGMSLEVHTFDHPCPLLQGGFDKAKATYDKCVDLMFSIPNNTPVAYRMPCCDSLNTVSPRFYKEIFNKSTPGGKFLQISSSVFQVYTADDPDIPRELLFGADGKERFRKYFPKGLKRGETTHDRFLNYVENYPYPYVIDRLCWEFPCMTPSDWEANFLHQPNNPQTVADMKAALDITVLKQGILNLVFHPHGWIQAEQINELIDHAVTKHGKKVKFLTFKEALERLNKHMLAGQPLRDEKGNDYGVRLLDYDGDGLMDVLNDLRARPSLQVWSTENRNWRRTATPLEVLRHPLANHPIHLSFGICGRSESLFCTMTDGVTGGFSGRWSGTKWIPDKYPDSTIPQPWPSPLVWAYRDIDGDGESELFLSGIVNDATPLISKWNQNGSSWHKLQWSLPNDINLVDAKGRDSSLRFIDVNGDGSLDIIISNAERYGAWLFESMEKGWSIELLAGKRGSKPADQELPPIVRADGTDNGFFVRDRGLHWINEDTAHLANLAVSWDFDKLLGDRMPAAKTPRAAVESMRVRPGFTVELMAHEPMVMDPVAFQWGPDGKLWVAEMADYPNGIDGKGAPGGRVRFLEDTDADGQYDRSTVFLDTVSYPNGVHPWKNGVLVSAAPDIFFAADTDGDGKADVREVLYTGFAEGNQQHRVNGFAYGLDGWLYVANGDSGGGIKSLKTGETLNLSGRDLRIDPRTGKMDAITGQSQFGLNRDDWGNWFGNNNSRPMWHYVLEDRYLRRNPHYAPPDPKRDVSVHPGAARVYPVSKTLTRFNDFDRANRFTSACSAMVYRDDLFAELLEERKADSGKQKASEDGTALSPSGFPLSALSSQLTFVSEPVHNLVHCEVMTPNGVSFTSRRLPDEQEAEFLASTDSWFRPTQLKTGPDGALWIADMYRLVIEHPQWIPQEWQEKLDVRAGADKGRLWRVYPANQKPRSIPRLDKLTTEQLVAALDSPSGWQRDMAQQLLIERMDAVAIPMLQALAARSAKPQTRLQALCTLVAMDASPMALFTSALEDEHPQVRRQVLRMLGELGEASSGPPGRTAGEVNDAVAAFKTRLKQLADDDNLSVRLQLALELGNGATGLDGPLLAKLVHKGQGDRYLLAAVFSSLNDHNIAEFAKSVLSDANADSVTGDFLSELIAQLVAFNQPTALAPLMAAAIEQPLANWSDRDWKLVERLMTSMAKAGHPWKQWNDKSEPPIAWTAALHERLAEAMRVAGDDAAPPALRASASRLSRYAEWNGDALAKAMKQWLQPTQPPEVQLAAVEMFRTNGSAAVTTALIGRWRELSPNTRAAARQALLARTSGCLALLEAVQQGELAAVDFDAVTRQRLLDHNDRDIRQRAESLLGSTTSQARSEIIATYQPIVRSGGDAQRGGELFRKTCMQCHKLGDVGHAVGPDLRSLTDKSSEAMLTAVLDPNRAVETKFLTYTAVSTQGQSFTGIMETETATSITLLAAEGKQHTLLRRDLEELQASNKSLMPEGLEKDISPAMMADLIAFVRANVPLPVRKEFPGNVPGVVTADSSGQLRLTPHVAEIYGSTIVLEEKHGNLGYWSSADDVAVWTIDVPLAGVYAVQIDYACDAPAGHRLVLGAGKKPLSHRVDATADWDDYRQITIGTLDLERGVQRLTAKPAERPLPALLDLKSITLTPMR